MQRQRVPTPSLDERMAEEAERILREANALPPGTERTAGRDGLASTGGIIPKGFEGPT
jgi:hypothetical protein